MARFSWLVMEPRAVHGFQVGILEGEHWSRQVARVNFVRGAIFGAEDH